MQHRLQGLLHAYDYVLEIQARNREKHLTDFDKAVAEAIFTAGHLALEDRAHDNAKYRVVSAPTGSGKSSHAIAFIKALLVANEGSSAVFLCETIDQCDDTYRELIKLISTDNVAIWTSFHDQATKTSHDKGSRGDVSTPRFWVDDLDRHRVAVVTHSFYKGRRGHLCRTYRGKPRTLTVLDERPNEVSLFDLTTGDVKQTRDRLAEIKGTTCEGVKMLTDLHDYLERLWQNAQSKRPYESLSQPVRLTWCTSKEAHSLLEETNDELLQRVLGFGKALNCGFAFMARYSQQDSKGARFIGYELDMPVYPGTVLLDATSDIDGVSQVVSHRRHVAVPTVNFRNLTITHIAPSADVVSTRARISEIVKTRKRAEPYAAWIVRCIEANTKVGEHILAVTHKRLLDHEYVPSNATSWDRAFDLGGRKVCFINWGYGIGSNRWKEADAVFLFGEFHIPKRATVGQTLGLLSKPATGVTLADFQSPNSQQPAYLSLREGHLLRWEKQLAMRGNARNIDRNGVCGKQRLYVTGEFARFAKYKELLFPGATLVQSPGSREVSKRKGGVEALVSLLSSSTANCISTAEINREAGVDMHKHRKRYLANTRVRQSMADHRWRYISGRGRGNRSRFQRITASDYGFTADEVVA